MNQNMINIRVLFSTLQATKMMQFDSEMPISEVIKEIAAKYPDTIRAGTKVDDYGLYQQDSEEEKFGRWFNKQVGLSHYNIKHGDCIEMREINRLLKFKLADGTMKTIMIDESKIVGEIFKTICSRSGITTVDEYSLALEETPEEGGSGKKDTAGTVGKKGAISLGLTIKKIEERERKKLERKKQKLHTDDEIRWLEHDKPLCEQGIDRNSILLLKRKYFYESNRNILDPLEVNILYNQCRDSILNGSLLCNQEEAVKLAAIQIYIQVGNYNEQRYKTLNVKEYLAVEHQKNAKSLEKKIKEEHKLLDNTPEVEAKQRYTTLCQGLKLYGVSIFLVKEKIPGKQKLGPIIFGITKESVMRLDEKTKEVLKTWQLTCVKRWAASPNSFTLDFGDYDEMYSIMTSESEQISKLISGYIDLILRKKRAQAYATSTTGVALMEENITPGQGVVRSSGVKHAPHGTQRSGRGANTRTFGDGKSAQKFTHPQKAFIYKLEDVQYNINDDVENIMLPIENDNTFEFSHLTNRELIHRKIALTNLANLSECFGRLAISVYQNDKENLDYSSLCTQISESKQSLLNASRALVYLAALDDDIDEDELNKLIQELADAYRSVFDSMKITDQNISDIDYQQLALGLQSTSLAYRKIMKLIVHRKEGEGVDDNDIELLLQLSKSLAKSVQDLIDESKMQNKNKKNDENFQQIMKYERLLESDLNKFISVLNIISPFMDDDKNNELLLQLASQLSQTLLLLSKSLQNDANKNDSERIKSKTIIAEEYLKKITDIIQNSSLQVKQKDTLKRAIARVLIDLEGVDENTDFDDLKERSRELSNDLTRLLGLMKTEINSTDDESLKNELFSSAKSLADITKLLCDNLKLTQGDQMDLKQFLELQKSINLETNKLLQEKFAGQLSEINIDRLKKCLECVISATILLEPTMRSSSECCKSEHLSKSLIEEANNCEKSIYSLINALQNTNKNPDYYNQQELLQIARNQVILSNRVIILCKNSQPLIADIGYVYSLEKATNNLEIAIEELQSILKSFEINNEMRFEIAKLRVIESQKYLTLLHTKIDSNQIPAQDSDNCEMHLAKLIEMVYGLTKTFNNIHEVKDDMDNLSLTLEQISQALINILTPLYNIAACSSTSEEQKESCRKIITTVETLTKSTIKCIESAQKINDGEENYNDDLMEALRNSTDTLLKLIESIPSNKDLEAALQIIKTLINSYETNKPALPLKPGSTIIDLQQSSTVEINRVLKSLSTVMGHVSRKDIDNIPGQFLEFTKVFAGVYNQLHSLAHHLPDKETSQKISESTGILLSHAYKLASCAKLFIYTPNANTESDFSDTARMFSETISSILVLILASKPGLKELENFKTSLKLTYTPRINKCNSQILVSVSFQKCINMLEVTISNQLPSIFIKVNKNIDSPNTIVDIPPAILEWEKCINSSLDHIAHASYLIGTSDLCNVESTTSVYDKSQLVELQTKINESIKKMTKYRISNDEINEFMREFPQDMKLLVANIKSSCTKLGGSGGTLNQKELTDHINNINNKTQEILEKITSKNMTKIKETGISINESVTKIIDILSTSSNQLTTTDISDRGKLLQGPIINDSLIVIHNTLISIEELSSLIQNYNTDGKNNVAVCNEQILVSLKTVKETLKSQWYNNEIINELIARLKENCEDINISLDEIIAGTFPKKYASSQEYETRADSSINKSNTLYNDILSSCKGGEYCVNIAQFENLVDLLENLNEITISLCNSLDHLSSSDQKKLVDYFVESNESVSKSLSTVKDSKQFMKNFEKALSDFTKYTEFINSLIKDSSSVQRILRKMEELKKSTINKNITPININNLRGSVDEILKEKLKDITNNVQIMSLKSVQNGNIIESKAEDIYKDLEICASIVYDKDLNKNFPNSILPTLQSHFDKLIDELRGFIKTCYDCNKNVSDKMEVRKLIAQSSKRVNTEISEILKILKSLHIGAVECDKVEQNVVENINECETLVMFAENKSLEKENIDKSISELSEIIYKNDKILLDSFKELSDQQNINDTHLLNFANNTNDSVNEFFDTNKKLALSIGSENSDNQLLLLNASIEFGNSLNELIENLKNNSSNNTKLNKSDIDKVTTNLNKHKDIVKNIEQKMVAGVNAISDAIKNIKSYKLYLKSTNKYDFDPKLVTVPPEDLIRISKDIPLSCVKITQAHSHNKVNDIEDLLKNAQNTFEILCKNIRKLIIDSDESKLSNIINATHACIDTYINFIDEITKSSAESNKNNINDSSKKVKNAVVEFVKRCSELKDKGDYVDPNDPTVQAERELLNAAASIEMAAKKLSELRPRVIKTETNKELNFEGQILEAANSIMNCTALLVAAATSAQKELIKSNALNKKSVTNDNGQWSQGLISASRFVADSTNMLCDAAKDAIEGKAGEEKLVAACNSISASTTQLIMACKVKVDPNSENQIRLEKAGNAVKKASKTLVESLKGSGVFSKKQQNEKDDLTNTSSNVNVIKREMDAMEEILRREKELNEAREKLFKIRQAKADTKKD